MHVEPWSLLVVGEAFQRAESTYEQFLDALDLTPRKLQSRLSSLVRSGLMTVTAPTQPLRARTYALTPKGLDLIGVVTELNLWSERWDLEVPSAAELNVGEDAVEDDDEAEHLQATISLRLLGAFGLRVADTQVDGISIGSQRLLVFLAIHDRAVARGSVAGIIWPESSRERAGFSLRSALTRLNAPAREAVLEASGGLSLADEVVVDLHEARSLARRVINGNLRPDDDELTTALQLFSLDLLPDWPDDWILEEAEDWRQVRVEALEALSTLLLQANRMSEATAAARAAMKVSPLRESAHANLMAVHLAQGNRAEAMRVFERYSSILDAALGIRPTAHLLAMATASGAEQPSQALGT